MASAVKLCPDCGNAKPLTDYHLNRKAPDGRQRYCKACKSERYQRGKATRREESGSSNSSSEEGDDDCAEPASLYVLTNPRIPGEYKVGRSNRVEQRRAILQAGHNFQMIVVACFPGAGHVEGLVHDRLQHTRVRDGPGREWFKATLGDIFHAVGRAMESDEP